MKKVFATFLFCIFAICVQSQNENEYARIGFRFAAGGSTMKGMDNYERKMIIPGTNLTTIHPYRSGFAPAWDFGFTIQKVKNRLLIQGDFLYSMMNTRVANAFIDKSERVKKIQSFYNNIAINFGTMIPINENYRFIIGIGPYIGFDPIRWLTSSDSYSKSAGCDTTVPYEGILDTEDADYRNFDFGGSVLFGLEYQRIQFALNYYHGLYNIVKDDHPLYNRSYKLSLIYFF